MEINLNLSELAELVDACSEYQGKFKTNIDQRLLRNMEDERATLLKNKRELVEDKKKDFTHMLRSLVVDDVDLIERCREIISQYDYQIKSLITEIKEIESL